MSAICGTLFVISHDLSGMSFWVDVLNGGTPAASDDTNILKIVKNKKLLQFALEERWIYSDCTDYIDLPFSVG
jgi:hypothetical protein